jgi:hypothetical protein
VIDEETSREEVFRIIQDVELEVIFIETEVTAIAQRRISPMISEAA